jgi:hypothetical protein
MKCFGLLQTHSMGNSYLMYELPMLNEPIFDCPRRCVIR